MTVCTACSHPNRAAIDKWLTEGKSIRVVGAHFGLAKSSVARHQHKHMGRPWDKAENTLGLAGQPQVLNGTAHLTRTEPPASERMQIKPLSRKQQHAAQLVAEDSITDRQISAQLNINVVTLERWKLRDDFQARVTVIRERMAERILNTGLARKEKRVEALTDLHDRMMMIIRERGNDPRLSGAPGGKTGLVTRIWRSIEGPDGKHAIYPQDEADVALVREIRATQDQIAIECGHRLPAAHATAVQINIAAPTAEKIALIYAERHSQEDLSS